MPQCTPGGWDPIICGPPPPPPFAEASTAPAYIESEVAAGAAGIDCEIGTYERELPDDEKYLIEVDLCLIDERPDGQIYLQRDGIPGIDEGNFHGEFKVPGGGKEKNVRFKIKTKKEDSALKIKLLLIGCNRKTKRASAFAFWHQVEKRTSP